MRQNYIPLWKYRSYGLYRSYVFYRTDKMAADTKSAWRLQPAAH